MSARSSEGGDQSLSTLPGSATLIFEGGAATEIKIPGGNWLLRADFVRQGGDLLVEGPSGETVLVKDFFNAANPPALVTDTGATLKGALVEKLAGPIAPGQVAQAGTETAAVTDPIGRVVTAEGEVSVTRADGTVETLAEGDPVFMGDVVETGDGGALGLEFADESTFSLGDSGRMVLDEFVYDPVDQTGEFGISLVEGAFSFVSGQIAKTDVDAMTLDTPVATIGIRGTTVAGSVGGEGNDNPITLLQDPDGTVGEVVISNAAGTVVISSFGATVVVTSFNAAPPPPVTLTQEQIDQQYGGVIQNLPNPPGNQPGGEGDEAGQEGPQEGPLTAEEFAQLGEINQDIADAINVGIQQQAAFAAKLQTAKTKVDDILAPKTLPPQAIQKIFEAINESVNVDFSSGVSEFSSSISDIASASTVAAAAETEAASQSVTINANAASALSASDTGLTTTQANAVADVVTAPLDALNAAAAISAAAAALAKVNEAAATYAATGEAVPTELQQALSVGSLLTTAATQVRAIIDAVVSASTSVIDTAVAAAKANPGDAYNQALAAAASAQGTAIDAELAAANAGITYAQLQTILDGVADALTTISTLLASVSADLQSAVTDTLTSASESVTAAKESSSAAYDTIAETNPTTKLVHAQTASTKADLAQTKLQAADDALVNYKVLAPVDASALASLNTLSTLVSDAENQAVAADQSISGRQAVREAAEKYRSGEAAQDVTDAQTARASALTAAQTEKAQSDAAADAVLAARATLVTRLVDSTVAEATYNSWVTAVGDAQDLVDGAAADVQAAQDALQAEIDKKAANPDGLTGQLLEAFNTLQDQLIQNAQAELDFQQSIKALFDQTLSDATTERDDALTDYNAKQALTDAAQTNVDNLVSTFNTEFDEAVQATRALSDADAALAKAEGFLSLAQSAAEAESQKIFDIAINDALAKAELAAAQAEAAQQAADEAVFYARFPENGVQLADKVLAEQAAISAGGASQENTLTFTGAIVQGDQITIDLGSAGSATYTVPSNNSVQTLAQLEAALVNFVNNNGTLNQTVEAIADPGQDGVVKIRALARPGSFDIDVSETGAGLSVTGDATPTTASQTGAEQAALTAAQAAAKAAQNAATLANDSSLSQDPAAIAARAKALTSAQAAADKAAAAADAAAAAGDTAWAASDLADVINPTPADPDALAALLANAQSTQNDADTSAEEAQALASLRQQQSQLAEITRIVSELNAITDANDAADTAFSAHVNANGVLTASAGAANGKLVLTSTIAGIELDTTFTEAGSSTVALANSTAQTNTTAQIDTVTISGTPAAGDTFTLSVSANQVDTVVLTGTPEAGDTYTVTVNGTSVTYTVTGFEGGLSGVRDAIVSAVNGNGPVGGAVTAAAGSDNGLLTLTADTSGTAFTSSATATNVGASGSVADNFARSITTSQNLSTVSVSYTATGNEGSLGAVRDELVTAINQSSAISGQRGVAAKAAADAAAAATAAQQAETNNDAASAATAATNAATAAAVAQAAATAALAASNTAADAADAASAAASGAGAVAAREAERANNAAASAAQGSGSASNSNAAADSSSATATAASDLQNAQDEAQQFAQDAADEAAAAAAQARADAQEAAEQAAADKEAAEALALQQATNFANTAKTQLQLAESLSQQATAAASNVNQSLAATLADQAQAAADAAEAAAQAALNVALGKGQAALNKALEASADATAAQGFAGTAEAQAELAANAAQAVADWTSGDASAERLAAAKASAAAASASARAADAATSTADQAADAADAVTAPKVAEAGAQAAVDSRTRSLAQVEAKRDAVDDGNDGNDTDIERVWDAAIAQAEQALADAKATLADATAARITAETTATEAQSRADLAAEAAAEAATAAADAAQEAGRASAFEIGAQSFAQSLVDAQVADVLDIVGDSLTVNQAGADNVLRDALDAASDAASAAADAKAIADSLLNGTTASSSLDYDSDNDVDAADATAAKTAADTAAQAARTALFDALTELGISYDGNTTVSQAVAAIKQAAADAAALDDIDLNAVAVKPTQQLIDAQTAADQAQNAKVSAISATADSIGQAITSAQKSAALAGAQEDLAAAASADARTKLVAQVQAAKAELEELQAEARAEANRAVAAEKSALSDAELASARASDAQAAVDAQSEAAASAARASQGLATAQTSLTTAQGQLTAANTSAGEAAADFATISAAQTVDPEVYQQAEQAKNQAATAAAKASDAVGEVQASVDAATEAATTAATEAATALAAVSGLDASAATSNAAAAATAAGDEAQGTGAAGARLSATAAADSAEGLNTNGLTQAEQDLLALDLTDAGVLTSLSDADLATLFDLLANSSGGLVSQAEGFVTTATTAADNAITFAETANTALQSVPDAADARKTAQTAADAAEAAAATASGVAQVDSVTIAGTLEDGDSYSIFVNGIQVSVTVTAEQAADANYTIDDVRDALVTGLNANASATSSIILAEAGSDTGQISLTALNAGIGFTTAAQAVNGQASSDTSATVATTTANLGGVSVVAQVDTVTLVDSVAVGDQYVVTINGAETLTVTADSTDVSVLRTKIIDAINGDADLAAIVDAAAVENSSTGFTLTADVAGVAFTTAITVTDNANATLDNRVTVVPTTANLKGADDLAQTAAQAAAAQATAAATEASNVETAVAKAQVSILADQWADAADDAATGAAPAATADTATVSVGSTVEDGDIFRVLINGIRASYTANAGDGLTQDAVTAGLKVAIDQIVAANGSLTGVTATDNGDGTVSLSIDPANIDSASTTDGIRVATRLVDNGGNGTQSSLGLQVSDYDVTNAAAIKSVAQAAQTAARAQAQIAVGTNDSAVAEAAGEAAVDALIAAAARLDISTSAVNNTGDASDNAGLITEVVTAIKSAATSAADNALAELAAMGTTLGVTLSSSAATRAGQANDYSAQLKAALASAIDLDGANTTDAAGDLVAETIDSIDEAVAAVKLAERDATAAQDAADSAGAQASLASATGDQILGLRLDAAAETYAAAQQEASLADLSAELSVSETDASAIRALQAARTAMEATDTSLRAAELYESTLSGSQAEAPP